MKGTKPRKRKQITAILTAMSMITGMAAYGSVNATAQENTEERTEIESALNIANNDELTWSYDSQSDS